MFGVAGSMGDGRTPHVALLFRGEPFRSGRACTRPSDRFLRATFDSYRSHLVAVGVFLSVNLHGFPKSAHASLLGRVLALAPQPVVGHELVPPEASRTQADALRHAVSLYLNSTSLYESVIITRYDVALARPYSDWACDLRAPKIHLLAACWDSYRKRVTEPQYCTDDRLYAVHASQLRAFATTLHAGSAGCWVVAGHGCWDAMRDAAGGRKRIDLCIDASKHGPDTLKSYFGGDMVSQVARMRVFTQLPASQFFWTSRALGSDSDACEALSAVSERERGGTGHKRRGATVGRGTVNEVGEP